MHFNLLVNKLDIDKMGLWDRHPFLPK